MRDLLGALIELSGDASSEEVFQVEVAACLAEVNRLAGGGNQRLVNDAETYVKLNPERAFQFQESTYAVLDTPAGRWDAGCFTTPSLRELRDRAQTRSDGWKDGKIKLWVLDGGCKLTDIGALQAMCGNETLFQVASQFNCLESPGPYLARVSEYFSDPTQGPRASVSAFPGTLLRHYHAPGKDGQRFVQENEGQQMDLLENVLGSGVVQSGYLMGSGAMQPDHLAMKLESGFEDIRVGVHEGVEVVLGCDWDGNVSQPAARIGQVFTSTVAGGMYGGGANLGTAIFERMCRQLLRAAYLGTILAAVAHGRKRVVLTLIGGGVFSNPIPLIWEAILWAINEAAPYLSNDLHVILNGFNLGSAIKLDGAVSAEVAKRGGAVVIFDRNATIRQVIR